MHNEDRTGEEIGQAIGLKIAKGIAIGFAIFFAVVIGGLVLGWLVQYLWNETLVALFDVPPITFWQAFALFILAKIFFGFGGSSHFGHKGKGQRKHRRGGKDWWDKRAHEQEPIAVDQDEDFQKYWREKGKAAYEEYVAGKKVIRSEESKE